MEVFSVTMSAVCIVATLGLFYWYRRPKKMPPGPRGFPLFGVIPYLGVYPERVMAEWKKTYGPIMTARFGRDDWVILNDYEWIQQAFSRSGEAFAGRPQQLKVFEEVSNNHGLVLIDFGKKFKIQRKFGLMTLRGFGMGKRSMEDRVLEEAEHLNQAIQKLQEKPSSVYEIVENCVSNVICGVVFGRRFDSDDPWFTKLHSEMKAWFSDNATRKRFATLVYLPWLRYFPPFSGVMKLVEENMGYFLRLLKTQVEAHRSTFQKNELRDFIDAFLAEMDAKKETFTELQLLQYIRELFQAGTETLSSTLLWAIVCLIHYPQAQEKMYNEIIKVIGENGRLAMSMKDDMPYTSAFIHESLRFRTLAPLSLPHCTTKDVELGKYIIPKGTTVVPNIWAVHNDPDVWNEPEKFMPERHLDADGRFVKSNYVIPFSVGPRHCLGKQLAQMELFIVLASIVQKFEFLPVPGELPEIEKAFSNGSVFKPLPFKTIAKRR